MEEQISGLFGPPSLQQGALDGSTTWYYDGTSQGTVTITFVGGKVSRTFVGGKLVRTIPRRIIQELQRGATARTKAQQSTTRSAGDNKPAEAAPSKAQGVPEPPRRLEVPGIAVLMPGQDWIRLPLVPAELTLNQKTFGNPLVGGAMIRLVKNPSEAVPTEPQDVRLTYASVVVLDGPRQTPVTPDQLVAEFKDDPRMRQMLTGGERLITLDATPDRSSGSCATYHQMSEIAGALMAVGPQRFTETVFVIDSIGVYCDHPTWPQYRIQASFNQMYPRGQRPLAVGRERDTFLTSLEFTASRPVPSPNPGDAIRTQIQLGIGATQMEVGGAAFDRNQWAEAETAFEVALGSARRLGDTPVPARPLYYLASIARQNGQPEAESLYREALGLFEKYPEIQQDPLFGATLNDLSIIYATRREFVRAEPLMLRGLETREKTLARIIHE